jgi:hypothetical protein
MGSKYYINKDGELCIKHTQKKFEKYISVVVHGWNAPDWTEGKLAKYVLEWGQFQLIKPTRKPVIL